MIRVNLIKGLVVEEVSLHSVDQDIRWASAAWPMARVSETEFIESAVEARILPLHIFNKSTQGRYPAAPPHTETTYIAYTPEVQKLIGVPLDVYQKEIESLKAANYKHCRSLNKRYGVNARIRFLFTGRVPA